MKTLKVLSWTKEEQQLQLKARLDAAREYRKTRFEARWKANESLLFHPMGDPSLKPTLSYNSLAEVFAANNTDVSQKIHIPQVMKNLRFLHSQMSANPPTVMASPTSNETSDRRTADVANHLVDYGVRHYELQENVDLSSLSVLAYGTGFFKTVFNPHIGKVHKFDEEKMEITMSGDLEMKPILIWNLFIDPDATRICEIKYAFERHTMSYDTARSMFPEYEDILKENVINGDQHPELFGIRRIPTSYANDAALGVAQVEIFEYYEKADPTNGMAGRHCYCLKDGTVLGEMTRNPCPAGEIPYSVLTDIDIPGEVYGRTPVDYALVLSSIVDAMDNMILENLELHGNIKLVVFDGGNQNEESLSADSVEIISVDGTAQQAPIYLRPAGLSIDLYNLRANMLKTIDDVMGINEILQGQLNRELSGFAAQTALNAANLVRRRLFNKYSLFVRDIYQKYLMNVQKFWKTKRKVLVVGTEDALSVAYYEGADLQGGYSLKVDYGQQFSLDPSTRREEILQIKDLMVEAGISPKKIVQMLKYNEVDDLFDAATIAAKRQTEIFEEMIASYQDSGVVTPIPADRIKVGYHTEMVEAAYEFVMQRRFVDLPQDLKDAIYQHIEDRKQLAAQDATGGAAAPEQAGPGAGMAPIPGTMPGMPPAQPAVPQLPPGVDIGGVI